MNNKQRLAQKIEQVLSSKWYQFFAFFYLGSLVYIIALESGAFRWPGLTVGIPYIAGCILLFIRFWKARHEKTN